MSSTADNPQPLIVFLHIPKAGGTTLQDIVRRQYRGNEVVDAYTVSISWSDLESRPLLLNAPKLYLDLPPIRQSRVNVLMGHFGFDVRESLGRPVRYFTMLRNPVDRVVSSYYHVLREPTHRFYSTVRDMSLEQYVAAGLNLDVDNGQTRRLAWAGPESIKVGDGQCDNVMLETAKQNLLKCEAVGITERFDESLLVLQQAFGWSQPLYRRENVGSNRPSELKMSDSTREAILKKSALDAELYSFALSRHEEQIAAIPGFAKRLEEFQRQNKEFQAAKPSVLGRLRSLVPARSR